MLFDPLSIRAQEEIEVDLFAGGGGASQGIVQALGRDPVAAVNHDRYAVAIHKANHPASTHYIQDVFNVDPSFVTQGRPLGMLWLSPDCTHHSLAKGSAPTRDAKIRDLAMVASDKWFPMVKPRVMILENVQELLDWGPLNSKGEIVEACKGDSWRMFVRRVKRHGYRIDWRVLIASDYGAPTIRERLFVIARCDDQPIVWPEPTHGDPASDAVKEGRLLPWRTAAECIDWSLPCPSIFETSAEIKRKLGVYAKRPLADKTLRRIATGVQRYVIDTDDPFILYPHHVGASLDAASRLPGLEMAHADALPQGSGVAPLFVGAGGPTYGAKPVAANAPMKTILTENHRALVSSIMAPYGNRSQQCASFLSTFNTRSVGQNLSAPMATATTKSHHALTSGCLVKLRGTCRDGQDARAPLPTITAGGTHIAEVRAMMVRYYSSGGQLSSASAPMRTATTKGRMGIVTCAIGGDHYALVDICMRMLKPRELARGQGFPDSYILDPVVDGKPLTQTRQIKMIGNSVCPDMAEALIRANYTPAMARPAYAKMAMAA